MANIGIDLGTYNSAAAYIISGDRLGMVAPEEGDTMQGTIFPSFVEFSLAGEHLFTGQTAALHLADKPQQVIWGTKRLIGKPYAKVQGDLTHFAYHIREAEDGYVEIVVGDKRLTPKDIATFILQKVRKDAEGGWNPLGSVEGAVITHPAYFDAPEIKATREAANEAGFKQVELIPEPVAATLAYQLKFEPGQQQIILTIDWGAGTLDIVLATITCDDKGQLYLDQPNPPHGDMQLGGLDMDDSFLEWAITRWHLEDFATLFNKMKRRQSLSNEEIRSQTNRELNALRRGIEEAKVRLSKFESAPLNFIYQGAPRQELVSRTDLEGAITPCLKQAVNHINYMLSRSGMSATDIDHVLLIGGPMNMPCIRQEIAKIFASNSQVTEALRQIEERGFLVNPMEAVAIGAALRAQLIIGSPEPSQVAKLGDMARLHMTNMCSFTYAITVKEETVERVPSMVYRLIARAGQQIPCDAEYPREEFLPEDTPIGEGVPVKLLKKQVDPETVKKGGEPREMWTMIGDYRFFPFWRKDRSAFYKIKSHVDKDGVVSLELCGEKDTVLKLEDISKLDGKPIHMPLLTEEEFESASRKEFLSQVDAICEDMGKGDLPMEEKLILIRGIGEGAGWFQKVPPSVSRDEINELQAVCEAVLKEAQQEIHSPSLTQTERQSLERWCTELQQRLTELPRSLPEEKTQDEKVRVVFSQAMNVKESLRHELDRLKG